MKVLIPLMLIAVLSFPLPSWGKEAKELEDTIQEKKGDLTEIQKELKEKKRTIKKKWWEEKKITDTLDEIDSQLDRKEKELAALNAKKQEIERKITEHEREITKLETLLAALDERFTSRVRAMYKLHRVGVVRVLFSAEDYSDALRRYKAFQLIVESDLQLLKAYQSAIEEKETRKKKLIEEKGTLLEKEREIETKQGEIAREKRRKTTLLASVKKERLAYQKAVAELEEREKALRSLLEELRLKVVALKEGNFKTLRGKLIPPVQGTFFSPQGRTKGIGIKAPEGAEIRSVFNGKVVYASWFKGYGNLMIIDHGGGYHTVFGHISRLLKEVDEEVKTGEVVALVGSTGSIEGFMLYFEIRHHGRCEDPVRWLVIPREGNAKKK